MSQNKDDKLRFMESLLTQYESLVNDMNAELVQNHEILKQAFSPAADQMESISEKPQEEKVEEQIMNLKTQMSRKDAVIHNLQMQLNTMTRAKEASKTLWRSTLEQVERLEDKSSLKNTPSIPSAFLSKWKALHVYSMNLEQRLEKLTKEANFYRRKILEVRIEGEQLKKQCEMDKTKCVQDAQQVLKRDIEQLKSSAEQMRREFEAAVGQRLENEKKVWEYKEAQSLRFVRVQVEQLLLDNQTLEIREHQLALQVHNLEVQNGHLMEQRFLAAAELADAAQHLKQLAAHHSSSEQTQKAIEKLSVHSQTETLNLQPNRDQRFEVAQRELENEQKILKQKLEATQTETITITGRLQHRIQQLEALNMTLNSQFKEVNEKYENVRRSAAATERLNSSDIDTDYKSNVLKNVRKIEEQVKKNEIDKQLELKNLGMDKKLIDEKRKDLQICRLRDQVNQLNKKNKELMHLVHDQSLISSKWKSEFNELAKRTIS